MLTLINDFTFPVAQLSLEKRLSKQFSISPEIGVQPYNPKLSSPDTSLVKWNGFRVGMECRYYGLFKNIRNYNKPERGRAEKYISLNLFYRQNQYNSRVTYYKPNDTATYNDSFAANKKAWGINAIFGIQITKKRFVANFYGGIGLLSRFTKNRFREFDYGTDELERNFTVSDFRQQSSLEENSGVIGNVILGIRLGLRL
ncbi:MAG: hypothetical protein IT249_01275 [Chitinophagaceae bacterium]|nr:hypothetical protein [Chitinophagaceae bacterium]